MFHHCKRPDSSNSEPIHHSASTTSEIDFNLSLKKVGEFGLYQKLLLGIFLVANSLIYTFIFYTQLFILLEPPHRCSANNPLLTYPEDADLACTEYIPVLNNTKIVSWSTKECTSGWDYDFSSYFPTIVSENNWVCKDNSIPYTIQSVFYIGVLFGGLMYGYISDKYGRKTTIMIASTSYLIAGILSGVVNQFYVFIIMRFIIGSSSLPFQGDGYILTIEYIGKDHRTWALLVLALAYSIFPAAYPFFPKLIRDWRLICIIGALPAALFLISYKLIPESACWLLTQGKTKEAIKNLKTVAKVNGKEFSVEFKKRDINQKPESAVKSEETPKAVPLFALIKTPRLRKHTILLALIWMMTITSYYGTLQNTSKLGSDVYLSFMYGGLIEFPSVPWMYFSVDRLGRIWSMILSCLVAGIAGLLSLAFKTDTHVALLVIALIERVALTSQFSIVTQYVPEVFPTVIRSRAINMLSMIGTIGVITSPYILLLTLPWPYLPPLLCGILSFLIVVLVFFLPETLNHNLPHTVEEGENFGKDQKLFNLPHFYKKPMDETEFPEEAV